ncbi:MAG: alpha/beta hydrolase [Microgenomates group bacterium]
MKTIYILHGWTYSTTKWKPLQTKLEKEKINAILLRIPGLTTTIDRAYSIDNYVNWLDMELPKDEKVVIAGHSNGGRLALHFAQKFPERVEHLFLIDSAGVYHDDLYSRVKRGSFRLAAKIGRKFTNSAIARKILYKAARESDYQNANPIMKQTMKNMLESDKTLSLGAVRVPTTIMWGEKDAVTPLVDGLIMHARIKNSKMYTVSEAMHSPQFTHPEKIAAIIADVVT